MGSDYIPERGDIIKAEFGPIEGHEQDGFRPGLVLSIYPYNQRTNVALVVPITNQVKNSAFEVSMEDAMFTTGAALCQHSRTMDFRARSFVYIERASENIINDALKKIRAIVADHQGLYKLRVPSRQ